MRTIRVGLIALIAACAGLLVMESCGPAGLVLQAQTVPATVHAQWTPNAGSDNVTQYKLALDSGTAVVVPLSACTATLCTAAVTVPTFGPHVVSVVAENQALSTDPSLQESPATSVTFTLNQAPAKPANATVKP